MSTAYKTNNLLVPWGDDFAHEKPGSFEAADYLHEAIKDYQEKNEGSVRFELHYSTVVQYLEAVLDEAN